MPGLNGDSGSHRRWIQPGLDPPPLRRYVEMLRERWWVVVAAVLLGVLAAVLYLSAAPRVYEAQSDMLVTPVPDDDPTLVGLPLIRSASDPTRDVETAARLVENVEVAAIVKRRLGLDESPEALLDMVSVDPVAQSNVITITASSEDPDQARALANQFARSAIRVRTQRLHATLDAAIESLRKRIDAASQAGAAPADLISRLTALETLRSGPDPTLQFETRATTPAAPSSPRVPLAVAAATFCGLLLGVAGAFLLSSVDGRLRNAADVRSSHGLPVLATLPRQSRGFGLPGADGAGLPAGAEQAYRMLRLRLLPGELRGLRKGRALVITSPDRGEGKSTTALNLAGSIAAEGSRVIVMEVDLRRPRMWELVGEPPRNGLMAAVTGNLDVGECLVRLQAPSAPRRVRFLIPEDGSRWGTDDPERLLAASAANLLARARELADVVLVDAPPLAADPDALPFALHADATLVVARARRTSQDDLSDLLELLASHGRMPTGIALILGSRGFSRRGHRAPPVIVDSPTVSAGS